MSAGEEVASAVIVAGAHAVLAGVVAVRLLAGVGAVAAVLAGVVAVVVAAVARADV